MTSRLDSILIRPTRKEDADALRDLRLEALREHPEAFASDYAESAAHPPEHWRERAHDGAGDGSGVLYVAVENGRLVGMTGLYLEHCPKQRHSGTIWGVYIRPEARGVHLADRLIAACLDWARSRDVRIVRIGVHTANAAAIRCYLRCGFTVYGIEAESIRANGMYYDEILMQLRL